MPDETTRKAFGTQIYQTARLWRRAADQRLQPYGLTEATWLPLIRIARSPVPMRQKDLAAALSLDGSSIVRVLDMLETADLIKRQEEGEDRRAKIIVLTPKGEATVEKVEAVARAVREEALGDLSDEDIEKAFSVLDHICRVLGRSLEEQAS